MRLRYYRRSAPIRSERPYNKSARSYTEQGRNETPVKTKVIFVTVVLLTVTVSASAQGAKHVIEAKAVLDSDGVAAGASLKAAAVARIQPGFHVNEHKPLQEYLIPTEWKIEGLPEISVAKMAYPKGEVKKFPFSDEGLSVYEGDFTVGALLKVSRSAKPGDYSLKGVLRYQACNDQACLPPRSLPLDLKVKVLPRGTAAKRINAEVFHDVRFE